MLPATVPGAASQVAPAEAARIAAVLQAALSRATIVAYTLRLDTYAEWAAATGRPWNHTLTLLAFLSGPASARSDVWRQQLIAVWRGHVDVALVRARRDGLLRRSEAAALQWQDLSVEAPDGSGRLHIARSKTDQEAHGHVAYLT